MCHDPVLGNANCNWFLLISSKCLVVLKSYLNHCVCNSPRLNGSHSEQSCNITLCAPLPCGPLVPRKVMHKNKSYHILSWTGRYEYVFVSYPIHSRFSSEVPDVRSNQIRSTDLYRIRHNKLLHSYPVHITLNTAYFLHLVYLPFRYIGYAYFQLCLLIRSPVINFRLMFDF